MMDHTKQWNALFAAEDYVFGTAPNLFLTQQAARLPAEARSCAWPMARVATGFGWPGKAIMSPASISPKLALPRRAGWQRNAR